VSCRQQVTLEPGDGHCRQARPEHFPPPPPTRGLPPWPRSAGECASSAGERASGETDARFGSLVHTVGRGDTAGRWRWVWVGGFGGALHPSRDPWRVAGSRGRRRSDGDVAYRCARAGAAPMGGEGVRRTKRVMRGRLSELAGSDPTMSTTAGIACRHGARRIRTTLPSHGAGWRVKAAG